MSMENAQEANYSTVRVRPGSKVAQAVDVVIETEE
jgi:hypothetical protein